MNSDRAVELIEIEMECLKRNAEGCDRDCAKCDLVQEDWELKAAFQKAIEALKLNKLIAE